MLYDNNLGGDVEYAKDLLREIAKLKLWGLATQFSFDCLHDDEYIDLLADAGGVMAFIGLESLNEPSLLSVHKKHNRVEEYKELFLKLKRRGILTFTGIMLALDEDTPEYYESMPRRIEEIDPVGDTDLYLDPDTGDPLPQEGQGGGEARGRGPLALRGRPPRGPAEARDAGAGLRDVPSRQQHVLLAEEHREEVVATDNRVQGEEPVQVDLQDGRGQLRVRGALDLPEGPRGEEGVHH